MGLPNGFVRFIMPRRSYIGYLTDLGYTMKGKAMYYEDEVLKYQGIYPDNVRFRREPMEEGNKKEFDSFKPDDSPKK